MKAHVWKLGERRWIVVEAGVRGDGAVFDVRRRGPTFSVNTGSENINKGPFAIKAVTEFERVGSCPCCSVVRDLEVPR